MIRVLCTTTALADQARVDKTRPGLDEAHAQYSVAQGSQPLWHSWSRRRTMRLCCFEMSLPLTACLPCLSAPAWLFCLHGNDFLVYALGCVSPLSDEMRMRQNSDHDTEPLLSALHDTLSDRQLRARFSKFQDLEFEALSVIRIRASADSTVATDADNFLACASKS